MTKIYVVVTRALSEQFVANDLIERGFAAYTPITKRWTRSATGRRVKVEQAVLSRYVFVCTDDIDRDFDAVRHGRRVTDILSIDGKPRPLSPKHAQWVGRMLIVQSFGLFDATKKRGGQRSVGEAVRILAGMFKGQVGRLTRVDDDRVKVRVEGRHIKGEVSLRPEEVQPNDQAKSAA